MDRTELESQKAEIEAQYVTRDGIIKSPGKFHGEPVWAVAAYQWWMDGRPDKQGGNQEEGTNAWAAFEVDDALRAVYGIDANTYAVAIEETDQGFIYSRELTREEYEALGEEEEEEEEERDEDPDEPDEEDWVTADHVTFTRKCDGRLILSLEGRDCTEREMWAHIHAAMSAAMFWPNVWFISDHGNAHLMRQPSK